MAAPVLDAGRTAPVLQARQGPAAPVDPTVLEPMSVVDVVFLQQMVPHHEQALEFADAALVRSSDPAVRGVAEDVRAALPAELREMILWLASIGLTSDASGGVHAHSGSMSAADVTRLRGLQGDEFDDLFLDLMTEHQVGAVELARSAALTGSNTAVRGLAATISEREWATVVILREIDSGRS